MFNPRELMNKVYKDKTSRGSSFAFQQDLKDKPAAMNWADPYRPDDTVPPHVKEAVIKSLNSNAAHYCFPSGDLQLREAFAKYVRTKTGVNVDARKNIIVTNGSDTSFVYTMLPFMEPGECNEIMMPIPSYAHNFTVPPLVGGKSIKIPTKPENDFDLDIEEFEKRVNPKTKMVIFTNPNNPTGTVYTRSTMEKVADFCKRHNLICVVDQCFEDSVFNGYEYTHMMTLPGMFERTITINSISKNMGLCGFRVAFVVAPEEITDVLESVAVIFLGATNTMAQAGILAALEDTQFVEDMRQEWMARAKILGEILDTIPHIKYVKPQSGFFFWVDISHYGTDQEIVRYLAENANLLVSTGGGFEDPTHIRIIYGALQDRQECIDAIKRMKDALEKHPKNK